MAQRQHGGLHPVDVVVVIGTPEIMYSRKAALVLCLVIGNIDKKISRLALLRYQYAVFFIAEFTRFEPQGAVLLVCQILLLQLFQNRLLGSLVPQRAFSEPVVEKNTISRKAFLLLFHNMR